MPTVTPQAILDECYAELAAVLRCYLPSTGGGPMGAQEAVYLMRAIEYAAAEALVVAFDLHRVPREKVDIVLDEYGDNVALYADDIRRARGAKD